MASPVDTSVKWVRSTMPGAPVLTRAVGSLISLLDALLVNGWGQQTATSVVVAGGVATATFPTDHAAAIHSVVLVDGATPSGLNGEQKVTAVEPNVIKWATEEADGTATGVITVKMAPAGFEKPFTGTNLAAYKSTSPDAHGQFLRIADTTVEYARAIGYENMTAISTGTGLFPSSAQLSGGYYWGKSMDTSGTAATPYLFVSDGRMFYLLPQPAVNTYGPTALGHQPLAFGDLLPRNPAGDPFATLLSGGTSSWTNAGGQHVWNYFAPDHLVAVPRAIGGVGTAVRGVTLCDYKMGVGTLPSLPDPVTGAVPMGRCDYRDTTILWPRAHFPGVFLCEGMDGERVLQPGAIVDDVDGRALLASWSGSYVGASGGINLLFLDITGPWR